MHFKFFVLILQPKSLKAKKEAIAASMPATYILMKLEAGGRQKYVIREHFRRPPKGP
jgi:hypothetical protein